MKRLGVVGALMVLAVGLPMPLGGAASAHASTTAHGMGRTPTAALGSDRAGVQRASAGLWEESGWTPLPAPVPGDDAEISADALASALNADLSQPALGPDVGAAVGAANTGDLLFDRNAEAVLIPASLTKILTAAAVLEALDPSHRFVTRTVLDESGNLVLIGSGDPMLRGARSEGKGASLQTLAQLTAVKLRAAGQATQPRQVIVDIAAFTGPQVAQGWSPEDLAACYMRPVVALIQSIPPGGSCDPGVDPQISAGRLFAQYLAESGIPVVGDVGEGQPVGAAANLAEVHSPALPTMVEQILLTSDNTGAELLAHAAGGALLGDPSFAGGSAATTAVLNDLGIATEGLSLADASGMSADNRASALMVLQVLQSAGAEPTSQRLWPVLSGLPTAAFDGTLATRFSDAEASAGRGDVRAKTGTLTGVSALAGQAVTDSGQLLRFAFITNSAGSTLAARADLDEAAAALAECGCQ